MFVFPQMQKEIQGKFKISSKQFLSIDLSPSLIPRGISTK